jgi:hypothetical protein
VLHALADVSTDRVDAHAHICTEGAHAFPDRVDAIRGSSMQHTQTVADALAERLDTLPLIRANASPSMEIGEARQRGQSRIIKSNQWRSERRGSENNQS